MRTIALVIVVGAARIAAAEPIDAILDSDDIPTAIQQAQLRDYLAHNPSDVDRSVIAGVKLGEATWRAACPAATTDGLCIQRVPLAKPARGKTLRCGDGSERSVVVARDARKTADAATVLHRAELAFESAHPTTARTRAYYARARVLDADRGYEANARVALPALDFDPDRPTVVAASKAKLAAWVDARRAAQTKLAADYAAIAQLGDREATLAAAARTGQLSSSFAESLSLVDIPVAVRAESQDGIYAYCDRVIELADPAEHAAMTAFEACMHRSTELGWFTDYSRLCERELTHRKPRDWPPAAERHATADGAGAITDLAPPK
jgi:hypothetical protein